MQAFVLLLSALLGTANAEELWPEISTTLSAKSPTGSKDAALIVAIGDYWDVADIAGARTNAR